MTVVEVDGELRGPDLPESFEWPAETVAWWETWRTSAQGQTFTDTDWSFLLDTAVLHAEFWLGDRSVAPELRLRVAKFGATLEDRQRLKIAATGPGEAKRPALKKTKATTARKARLLKVVGGDGEEEA